MKFYISFSQGTMFDYSGQTIDCHTLLEINDVESFAIAKAIAIKFFNNKWWTIYTDRNVPFEYFRKIVKYQHSPPS